MHQKRLRVFLYIACLVAAGVLPGCYSSQQLVQPSLTNRVSHDPQFMNNITVAGNSKVALSVGGNGAKPQSPSAFIQSLSPIQDKFSSIFSALPGTVNNLSIYSFISDWYGVRYRMGGVDKRGIDCSAFVQKFYDEVFGMRLLRTAFEQFNNSNILWNTENLKEGDLVFFKVHSRRISHVGVYLINNFFVHASSSQGVVISSLNDKYWQKYYSCAGRVL